jgi:hypothetical protein
MTFSEQASQRRHAMQNDPHLAVVGESQDGMYGSSSADAINSVGE